MTDEKKRQIRIIIEHAFWQGHSAAKTNADMEDCEGIVEACVSQAINLVNQQEELDRLAAKLESFYDA